jgi:monoamine oxidase
LHNVNFPAEAQHEAWAAYLRFIMRLHRDPPASDRASDALAADDPWRPFIDALSSFLNGAELDTLSVKDFLAYDDAASDNNWRLPSGYGAFIASQAAGIPATLGTTVTAIRDDGAIMLETSAGALRAKAAIVAVPTSVLARGAIALPPAANDHLHAASQLPLGIADKVFLSLAEPDAVPAESHLLGRLDHAATGSYYLRPFGRPIVECFLGGSAARGLEDADAFAFAIEELSRLLGAEFARRLAPVTVTRWAHEPTIGGSYSHALPGCAGARAVLARPVSERLCFAGEACSAADYSTAHGAWERGIAAADWIARGL